MMQQPGAIGYVVINFDGIPVKQFPDDPKKMPAVQYAALIADLVVATKKTLDAIHPLKLTDPVPTTAQKEEHAKYVTLEHIRMRTSQDTEMIVTNYTAVPSGNEYILVVIQTCKFSLEEEVGETEEVKA